MLTLSIIIPAFNEESNLKKIVDKVMKTEFVSFKLEIILVDDGSTDQTFPIMTQMAKAHPRLIKCCRNQINRGKGAALKLGFSLAKGQILAIQDADLEYQPAELAKLCQALASQPDLIAIYGSRVLGKKVFKNIQASGLTFLWGGLCLTQFVNLAFKLNLTDQPVGYKVFRSSVLPLVLASSKCVGFDFEIELTYYLHQLGKIGELPIHYLPRTIKQGKKINLGDFLSSLVAILNCWLQPIRAPKKPSQA